MNEKSVVGLLQAQKNKTTTMIHLHAVLKNAALIHSFILTSYESSVRLSLSNLCG